MPTFPPIFPMSGLLRRLPIFALLLSVAPAALAQLPAGAVVQHLPQSDDPAELLAQALRTLATEPGNLTALTAAGHNALALGDPNAAVGFFGRAQEIAPSNGAIKAGLGSALVQLEKPQDALRLFAEASRLGVPDADIAEDRGLAYDLTGQQSFAQRDYQTVLAAHPEDETARRRLALSQGISGNKAGAIATLDPLIRKRDIAGWRAQTFVLAMDGDAKGANDITRIMLPQQAMMLQPFLVRLSSLSPADKARAVHFGEMPATGATYTPTQVASVDTPATYASAPLSRPSDLAPVKRAPAPVRTPTVITPQQPAPGNTTPAQVAAATPVASRASRPANTAATGAVVASAQSYYRADPQGAPLAGIALTPAREPSETAATSAAPAANTGATSTPLTARPPVQLAQSTPPVSAAPAASMPMLPTPAAQGHYDLPHDAAMKSGARPTRPTITTPVKTIGTPVVHGKTTASASADDAPEVRVKTVPAKTKLAATDDGDAAKAKAHGKASGKDVVADDDIDAKPAKKDSAKPSTDDDGTTAKSRRALASADDCAPAPKPHARSKARSKLVKASARCTELASADQSDDASTKTSKAKTAKGKRVDVDDGDAKSSKAKKSAKAAEKPAVEHVYVQVAGGANKDDMDKAWAGVKKKAPELMKGHTPSTAPLRATNRLLVGPFKSDEEAQAFVNKMAAKGLSGFTVKTGKVAKVDTGP